MEASFTMPGRMARRKKPIPQRSGADLIVSRTIPATCLLVSMLDLSTVYGQNMRVYCKRNVKRIGTEFARNRKMFPQGRKRPRLVQGRVSLAPD